MENVEMLDILNKIELFLKKDSIGLARDYIRLEIDNLKRNYRREM